MSRGVLYLCVALSVVAVSAYAEPAVGAVSKVTFDSEQWDFGRLAAGKKVMHIFVLTNSGARAVRVERVRGSCSCVSAAINRRLIGRSAFG